MIFQTAVGILDIIAGDYVKINSEILPTPPSLDGYVVVNQISDSNTKQVQVQYSDESGSHLVWLDATWISGNLRPILPT